MLFKFVLSDFFPPAFITHIYTNITHIYKTQNTDQHCTESEVCIKNCFADLVIFTKEIVNEKFSFFMQFALQFFSLTLSQNYLSRKHFSRFSGLNFVP